MKIFRLSAALILAAVMLLSSSCGAGSDGDVPTGMKKIEMDIDDYSFFVPQGWTEDLATGVASAYLPDNSNVSVMTIRLDKDTPDIDSYWKKTEEDFKSTFGTGFEYVGENPQNVLFGGVDARKYVYTASVTGTEYKFMQVVCMRQSSTLLQSYSYAYVFTYTAETDKFDGHLDDVEDMLANFRFNDGKNERSDGASDSADAE
ncbi:MAG: hypothetical protein IJT91_03615 [Clostridia bacterium]|nr:hypothetical protein [Clostridia bacterium]